MVDLENNTFLNDFISRSESCQAVNELNNSLWKCAFIKSFSGCQDNDGFLDYTQFVFCTLHSTTYGMICLSLWLIVLFIGLGITADDFLCPSLLVISRTLRLSHNIAGVTFLAFGNGAPDIFSSIAAINQENPQMAEMVIGELFGAGIFVTTVVTGSILIVSDFKTMGRPLCRDIVFYMMAAFLAWFIFFQGSIRLKYAIAFVCLYIFYIFVVIGSGIIYTKFLDKKKHVESSDPPEELSGRVHKLVFERTYFRNASKTRRSSLTESDDTNGVVLRRFDFRDTGVTSPQRRRTLSNIRYPFHHHATNAIYSIGQEQREKEMQRDRSNTISDNSFPTHTEMVKLKRPPLLTQLSRISVWSEESITHVLTQWKEFIIHISPIDVESWKNDRWYYRIFSVIKAPVYFLLTITTPVVDNESEKNNWCKLLNMLQLFLGPQLAAFFITNGQWKIHAIVAGISFIIVVLVYFTSTYEKPPIYHWVFGYIGFLVSVSWIYALANEVVDLLQTFGIIFNLSEAILGLTILAWGNSLGDFVSNLSMARQGFPRMGIAACFGGPVLNLLLGIGVPYTIRLVSHEKYIPLDYSKMVTLLYSALTLSLASTLLILIINRFQSKRWHGYYLIALFVAFVTLAALIEWNVI